MTEFLGFRDYYILEQKLFFGSKSWLSAMTMRSANGPKRICVNKMLLFEYKKKIIF